MKKLSTSDKARRKLWKGEYDGSKERKALGEKIRNKK